VDKLTPEQKNVYWEYQRKQTGILKNKLKLLETQGTYNADILGRHSQKKSWTNMLGDILTRETNWNEPDQQETLMIFDEDEDDEDEEDDTELEEKDKKLIQILKLVTQKGPQEHYFVQYPTFDGNGDPYTWLEEYETACAINGIENGRKLDYLDAALKGDAKLWWRNVKRSIKCFGPKKRTGPEPKDSFKFHFIAEYCGLDRQWKWTDELRDLKQEQGMPVKKYAHRLKDLYKKADPLNRYPEHDKINQFLKGLRRDIGILVQTQNPMSLNQAIESAKNIERAFAQNGSFALASGDMNQELREIKAMIAQQNQVSKPFLKCNLCYKQGDHTTENCPRRTFKPKPGQIQQNRTPRTCFNCEQPGHISKDCNARRSAGPRNCYICNQKGHMALSCPVIKNNEQAKRMIQMNQKNTRNNGPGNNQRKVYHTQITDDDEEEISDTENENILATQKKLVNQISKLTEDIKSLKV